MFDNLTRRSVLASSAAAITTGIAGCAGDSTNGGTDPNNLDNFPARDVTVVHSGSVGGGNETYTHMLAHYLPQHMPGDGNFNVIRMRAGGGMVSHEEIYNADPDGYFFGQVLESNAQHQPVDDPPWNIAEMTHFGNFTVDQPSIWVGPHLDQIYEADRPVEVFADLVDDGELTFQVQTLTGAMIAYTLGEVTGWYSADRVLDNIVRFDSAGEGAAAVSDGDVDVATGSWTSLDVYGQQEQGDLYCILVATMEDELPDPDRINPEARTLGNALEGDGVPDGQLIADMNEDGRSYAGPPGMSDELTELYRDAFEAVANDEDYLTEMEEAGRPVQFMRGERNQEKFENKIEMWYEHEDLLRTIHE